MNSFFENKHILIAGGSGFIGNALTRRLVKLGAIVRATYFCRKPEENVDSISWVQADLTNAEDCGRVVEGIDIVLMCAASTSGAGEIINSPLNHLTPNLVMNARMLEAAYTAKVTRFFFISSTCVYPVKGDTPMREDQFLDAHPADVYFVAGWMKRYTEILCSTYATRLDPILPVSVVRPSNIYGPGDKFDWKRSHVTAATIRKVLELQNPIIVWGDGENRRDLIYIDDFVEAALRSCSRQEPYYCVNIGAGMTVSVNDILETALRVAGRKDVEIVYDKSLPQTIRSLNVDTTKLNTELDFTPSISLSEGIALTIDWYLRKQPRAFD